MATTTIECPCCCGVGWIFDGSDEDDDLEEFVCYWCQGERFVSPEVVEQFRRDMGAEPVDGDVRKVRCKHCKQDVKQFRGRHLCQRCFRDESIRESYPLMRIGKQYKVKRQPGTKMRICKNCERRYQERVGRGLCRVCWRDPKIKARYAPVCKFGGDTSAAITSRRAKLREEVTA